MTDWKQQLIDWKAQFHCSINPPVKPEILDEAIKKVQITPQELLGFYRSCNGLRLEWLSILPIEDPANTKKTWDGLVRANTPQVTRFLEQDETLLKRFLVFAALDAGTCAMFDRADGTIWFEDFEELRQTDLSLSEFIETCLREVIEL